MTMYIILFGMCIIYCRHYLVSCAYILDGFVKASNLLAPKLNEAALKDVIEQLKRTPVGLDNVLARVVPQGVAYHHAG